MRLVSEDLTAGEIASDLARPNGRPTALPPRPEPFHAEVYPERDRVRVVAVGELDLATAGQLEEQLHDLDEAGFDDVVLDLAGLSFMDCSGLRVLIVAQACASETGRRLGVVGARGQIKRLMTLTGVDRQLYLSEQLAVAVSAPSGGIVTNELVGARVRGAGISATVRARGPTRPSDGPSR